jgi:kojibiose phosphorylase
MAQWNLERSSEALRLLKAQWPDRWLQLAVRLDFSSQEIRHWDEVAARMHTGLAPATGLFEQFRGYFHLENIDLAVYASRTVAMDVLLGRERIQQSQIIKQADVALLVYLLWERFSADVRETNFRYYEPRSGHGSSLSPAIHALLAARMGDVGLAEQYFRQTAEIDLANNMGNAAGGVHIAALGGLWQAAVFGFAGLRPLPSHLIFDPHLPLGWEKLRFPLQWRGRRLEVELNSTMIEVSLKGDEALTVAVEGGPETTIAPGEIRRTLRKEAGWMAWQEIA